MFCRFYTSVNKPQRLYQVISVISELFSLLILIICNILALSGINQDKPYLLIPWLVVYIIGIFSSYIGSFLIFSTMGLEEDFRWEGFFPLGLGFLFHFFWSLVRNTFNTMKEECRNGDDRLVSISESVFWQIFILAMNHVKCEQGCNVWLAISNVNSNVKCNQTGQVWPD